MLTVTLRKLQSYRIRGSQEVLLRVPLKSAEAFWYQVVLSWITVKRRGILVPGGTKLDYREAAPQRAQDFLLLSVSPVLRAGHPVVRPVSFLHACTHTYCGTISTYYATIR